MNELKWYILVKTPYTTTPQTPTYTLFREYSWQDAFDSLRKDRLTDYTWGIYALEKDGSYWDGLQFRKVDKNWLLSMSFEPGKRDP